MLNEEYIAKCFHETYEKLAPNYGYKTREATAVPWEDIPNQNKRLMIAVVKNLIADKVISPVFKT